MSDLMQSVTNGKVNVAANTTLSTKPNDALGKDAFLKLLCAQLQYQDPLNPQTDTEFVAQLAQYSQLEELQNLSSTNENSQALSLVGKTVVIQTVSGNKTVEFSGTIDYVTYVRGEAKVSVNGNLYGLENVSTVYDDTYMIKQNLPGISNELKLTYDGDKPSNLSFEVNLGKEDTVATQVGVIVNGTIIDKKYITLEGNKVTIAKEAFENMKDGTYEVAVVFNDYYYTTVADKVTLEVKNAKVNSTTDKNETEEVSDEAVAKLLEDQNKE